MVNLYCIKNKFESSERQFTSLKETLDRKTQEHEGILNNFWWYTDYISLGNLERLAEKELIKLMKNQNEVTQNIFSLNKTTLNLLQNSHEDICKDLNDLCKDTKNLQKRQQNFTRGYKEFTGKQGKQRNPMLQGVGGQVNCRSNS